MSRRPPISGKFWAARSVTGGEKTTFPLNHGLTVCLSEEATSTKWLAINERRWPETISCARRPFGEGHIAIGRTTTIPPPPTATGPPPPGHAPPGSQHHR